MFVFILSAFIFIALHSAAKKNRNKQWWSWFSASTVSPEDCSYFYCYQYYKFHTQPQDQEEEPQGAGQEKEELLYSWWCCGGAMMITPSINQTNCLHSPCCSRKTNKNKDECPSVCQCKCHCLCLVHLQLMWMTHYKHSIIPMPHSTMKLLMRGGTRRMSYQEHHDAKKKLLALHHDHSTTAATTISSSSRLLLSTEGHDSWLCQQPSTRTPPIVVLLQKGQNGSPSAIAYESSLALVRHSLTSLFPPKQALPPSSSFIILSSTAFIHLSKDFPHFFMIETMK